MKALSEIHLLLEQASLSRSIAQETSRCKLYRDQNLKTHEIN
jgi:hypothetical protein